MGQPIQVAATRFDNVLLLGTDRTLSGQDGIGFASAQDAESSGGYPGLLASRLFAADPAVDHVFVAGNNVVVGRTAPWGDEEADAATRVVADLFVHYPEATAG